MKKHFRLLLDTEGCHIHHHSIVYNIGGVVIDNYGKVYASFSFIISDIFDVYTYAMANCYYKEKLPKYYKGLENGTYEKVSWNYASVYIKCLIEEYNIKNYIAHNCSYDRNAIRNTDELLNASEPFLTEGIEFWDTLAMAKDIFKPRRDYTTFCKDNGYITSKGSVQLKAEILYRFLINDTTFIEEHTALADTLIEKEIYAYCMAKHTKFRKR